MAKDELSLRRQITLKGFLRTTGPRWVTAKEQKKSQLRVARLFRYLRPRGPAQGRQHVTWRMALVSFDFAARV
jgi:hypothetical protein